MARRPARQMNRNARYVRGSLAYDYDYLERERQRREEHDRQRREEREQWEYAERRAREQAQRPASRRKAAAAPKHRERIRVSPVVVLGFAAAAVLAVALLMSYAQMTAISADVVRMQRRLNELEDEHVELLGRYERTFDLTAIQEAAEAAGMAKPSASQITYVDLSSPDSVVLCRTAEASALGRALGKLEKNMVFAVEYFK